MIEVKIKPERDNLKFPKKMSKNAACYDVFAADIVIDEIRKKIIIYLGFSTEFEPNVKGVLVPRSSLTKTNWTMLNSPGIIDADFRGEWQMRLSNLHLYDDELPFKIGDAVGQIYFQEVEAIQFEIVDNTSNTERGSGGFGSTDK